MNKKSKGGKRPGAGRKPTNDPREQIPMYVRKTDIAKFGGKPELKEALALFIEKYQKPGCGLGEVPITDGVWRGGIVILEPDNTVKPLTFPNSSQEIKKAAEVPLKTISHIIEFDEKGNVSKEVKIQKKTTRPGKKSNRAEEIDDSKIQWGIPKEEFDGPKMIGNADEPVGKLPTVDRDAILNQIVAIHAEAIPEHRNTPMGRKAWSADQLKRIKELENKLNG